MERLIRASLLTLFTRATFVLLVGLIVCPAVAQAQIDYPGIEIAGPLRFQSGDNAAWADPATDDSGWRIIERGKLPYDWTNLGWFRFTLEVDTALWYKPLGMIVRQSGAVELYLDGKRIYKNGSIGTSIQDEIPYHVDWESEPQLLQFQPSGQLRNGKSVHLLALRYSTFLFESPLLLGGKPKLKIRVGDIREMTETRTAALENATTHQMFLTGIFVAFTVFHLLLFIFYPAVRENLIFSGLTFAAAFMVYFRFENYFITDPSQYITFTHLSFISTMAASLLSLRLVYFLVFESLPRRFYVAAGLAGILTVTIWFIPMALSSYLILFVGLMFLEIMRTIVTVRIRRHRELFEGSWIILLGFIPLSLAAVYKTFVTLEIMDEQITVMDFPLAMYAMLLLLLSVSVFLSRTYARTNRDLLRQLQEVRRLSEENLRQEVERTRLEAENERKRRELEAARDLQISMLPRKLPDIPDLEIAVYMKPATEVGGDYYDFQAGEDNDLTIAFGDATGHGMQAGIMVAASKSLFQTLASMQDLPAMLARISLTLKNMGFSNVFMAMSVARLRGNILEISSAGMPYALVHRAATSDVEEVILKGMPLGSFPDFPYQSKRVELQSGDTVLFMSDGLPELFNERDELLGDEATVALFAEAARKKPAQIIDHLVEAGEKWAGQHAQEDDITFLVMRKS